MNKIFELLEQYCQWLAIALGAAFLGWVLWAYILFSPVTQSMPDRTSVDPGTVDPYVKKMVSDPLQTELQDSAIPNVPTNHEDLTKAWLTKLDGTANQMAVLPPQWAASIPQDVTIRAQTEIASNNVLVNAMPTLPPAKPLDIKSARAFVNPVPVNGNNPQAAPVPAPVANNPNGVMPVAGKDISYVRLTYSIIPADIETQFKAVHIPSQAESTSIVEVKFMRQELVNGNWTDAVEIKPLANNVGIQPLPPLGAQQFQINAFNDWVNSDQGMNDLIRPAFFPVLSGEGPWDAPIDDLAATTTDAETLRKQQLEENRKAYEARNRRPTQVAPQGPGANGPPPGIPGGPNGPNSDPGMRPGRNGGRPSRRPSGVVGDIDRPASTADLAGLQLAQARPLTGRPPMPPPGMYPPGGMYPPAGMYPPPGEMPQAAAPAANATPPLPAANNFNPVNQTPIVGWAYDDTVVEGHTYRYQVIYAIRNPVYGANLNIVANAQLSAQFAIESQIDPAAWTGPITVKSTTEFYLASANWPSNSIPSKVRIEVFKWADGKWQSKMFDVSPGDRIGALDNQTNFQTSDALIDIRYDSRRNRPYVLVMGNNGSLIEHEPADDRSNPRHKQLQQIIAPPAAPGTAGGAPLPPAG